MRNWRFRKQKKIVSLLEFIKTGTFGGAQLNMTPQEVIASLGKPEDEHQTDTGIIFMHGWWEIHFSEDTDNKAHLIYNDHLLYDCINHKEMITFETKELKLNLDFIKPHQHIRFGQVLSYLDEQKIDYQLINKDYQPMVQFDNHVYMDFTDTEPSISRGIQFAWGPGRGQDLQEDETRIKKPENWILYTIGASSR